MKAHGMAMDAEKKNVSEMSPEELKLHLYVKHGKTEPSGGGPGRARTPPAKDAPLGGVEGILRDLDEGRLDSYTRAQKAFAESVLSNHLKDATSQAPTGQLLVALRKVRR